MNIKDCRAIVTGGSSGIGLATARALIAGGASHVGIFARGMFPPTDNGMYMLQADVRDPVAIQTAFDEFANKADGLDIIVNCAGILRDGAMYTPSSRYSIEDWDDTISTNLRGAFLCSRAATEIMFKRRIRGVIVNLSSVSRRGRAGQIAYAASKAGISAMTAAMAQELAAYKIRCVAIAPGLVDTPMGRQVPEQHRKEIVRATPVRRMGTAEEIADAVLFCIRNDFINGTTLEIDGGFTG